MDRNQQKNTQQQKKNYEYGGNEKKRYNDLNSVIDLLQNNTQKKAIVGDLEFPSKPSKYDEDDYDDDEIVEEAPKNQKPNTAYSLEGLNNTQGAIEKLINDGKLAFDRFGSTNVDLHKKENASYILADPRYLAGKKYATFSDFYRLDVNANGEYAINKIGFDEVVSTFQPDYERAGFSLRGLMEEEVKRKVFGFNKIENKGSAYIDEDGQKKYHPKEDDIAAKYQDKIHQVKSKTDNQFNKDEKANDVTELENVKALTDGTLYNEFVKFAQKNNMAVTAETKEDFNDNLKSKDGSGITAVNASDKKFLLVDPRVRTGAMNPEDPNASYYIVSKNSPNAKPKFEKVSFDKMVDFAEDNTVNKIKRPRRGFFGTIRDWFGKDNDGRRAYEEKKKEYLTKKYQLLEHKFGVKNLDYSAINGGDSINNQVNRNVENRPLVPDENQMPEYETALNNIDTVIKYCRENNVADNIRTGAENIKAYLVANKDLNDPQENLSESVKGSRDLADFKDIVRFMAKGENDNAAMLTLGKQGFCEAVSRGRSKDGIHDVDSISKNVAESFKAYNKEVNDLEKTQAEVERREAEAKAKEEAFRTNAVAEAKKAVYVPQNADELRKYVDSAKEAVGASKMLGAKAVKSYLENADPQLRTEAGKNIAYYLNTMNGDQRKNVFAHITDALNSYGVKDDLVNDGNKAAYEKAIGSAFEKAVINDASDVERAKNSLRSEMSESKAPAAFESKIRNGALENLNDVIKGGSDDAKLGAQKIQDYIKKDPEMKTDDCRRIVNYFAGKKEDGVETIGKYEIDNVGNKYNEFCENVGKLAQRPKATGNKLIDGILNVKPEPQKNSEYTKLIDNEVEVNNQVGMH